MNPRFDLDPEVVRVERDACVTVVFQSQPSGEVTVEVKDNTTNPPTTIASDAFEDPPYKLDFTPSNAGDHVVCVSWDGGSAEHHFDVER